MIEKGQGDSVALNLGAGTIPVTINGEILTMEQNQPEFGITVDKEVVAKALSIDPDDFDDAYPIQWVSTGLPCFAIPLKTVDAVGRCKVDHPSFAEFMKNVYQCNMFVFAREGEGLRARCFMDDPGYLEDPATGSANGDLAGYVLKHHYFGKDKVTYTVRQGIEMGRPSTLYINAERHGDSYKIFVGGKVCFVSEGEWK